MARTMWTKVTSATAMVVAGAALVVGSAPARADEDSVRLLQSDMETFARASTQLMDKRDVERHADTSLCVKAIAKARKGGAKDSDELVGHYFGDHPKAKRISDSKGYSITVSDAADGFYCDRYVKNVAYQKLRVVVEAGVSMERFMRGIKPEEVDDTVGMLDKVQACVAAADALVAGGASSGDTIEIDRTMTTIGEARAVCVKGVEDAKVYEKAVSGRVNAEADEIAKVYAAVGIKGDRLKLFSEIGLPEKSGFLAPGCTKYVDTAKGLAKAKKLFTWFESEDGSIVVTKYTFKGNKYKESEKRYLTSARAYKGCK